MADGRTPWFPNAVKPVRNGEYECSVRITNSQPRGFLWRLVWDGRGFLVPFPMIVDHWRGLTKKAANQGTP